MGRPKKQKPEVKPPENPPKFEIKNEEFRFRIFDKGLTPIDFTGDWFFATVTDSEKNSIILEINGEEKRIKISKISSTEPTRAFPEQHVFTVTQLINLLDKAKPSSKKDKGPELSELVKEHKVKKAVTKTPEEAPTKSKKPTKKPTKRKTT